MLDTETRRRIDTARDILVGKVPDPKSQVEQITIALIYKFMDDMDAKSEEFGGERQFFAGEFAQYGWASLMHGGLSGHDVLNLYADGITRMPENPGIPPLFRDIFNNAYLPYRDPETLRAFLKVIDEFTYDHSERLGDAFEYLLSVLGSQGDAGQFRTPRHIIDFIVAIIDPKKDETVLDPACGTAGFLISSWKHIEKAETDEKGNSKLTPDDKGRLAQNFSGYDISPDMVRLSRVNMYLHGFAQPRIHEYDTLTSEDRWNEFADVILANPPFMSPKGGIRPHNRFSVKSKRSEVLFVDYMAEHLTPEGRAGIIVPEGIIFQSQNAHKQLRKKLVEDYLVAVISLPAGVFNPYSGVKTSILILDRKLANQTDHIAFFKVENDGFDLGAQRRAIANNDLPMVREGISQYLADLQSDKPAAFFGEDSSDIVAEQTVKYIKGVIQHPTGLIVGRERIAADGEYNLSGERYRNQDTRTSSYKLVPFERVCSLEYGASLPKKARMDGPFPVMGSNGISGYHNKYLIEGPAIIVGRKGSAGEVVYVEENCYPIDTTFYVKRVNPDTTDTLYLYHLLKTLDLSSLRDGAGIPGLNRNDVYSRFKLPVPSLEVQREIVDEIENYQRVISGAKAVIDNYKPRLKIDPDWPIVKLGDTSEVLDRLRKPITKSDRKTGPYPYYGATGIIDWVDDYIFDEPLVLIGEDGAKWGVGEKTAFAIEGKAWINNHAHVLRTDPGSVNNEFLITILNQYDLTPYISGVTVPKLNQRMLNSIPIPLPTMETQITLVKELCFEKTLVANNQKLVISMEKKITKAIERVWDGGDS